MHKLSVITVTWNAVTTLERTLQSVGEQSWPLLEHLVIDGGSDDGTVELIRSLSHARMKWVSEPDKGLYDAMNKGAALASGDYLCFLNAGDTFFAAESVEMMMRSLEGESTPDILYGETAIVDEVGTFLHMRRLKAPRRLDWKSFRRGMVVCHQAFIVKRELFEPYDLAYRFSSDFDWSIRMMKKAASIHHTRLTLINYLNEGMTTRNHKASLKERYRIMAHHYGELPTFLHHLWFAVRALVRQIKGD